jgi:hypothetical protein
MRGFILLGAMLAAGIVGRAAGHRFASGPARTSLIELYTSEGCSSCPPAERWLGDLRDAPGLWRDFVPVEFHVNYWDRLGWPDRFATREFTQREYVYSAAWGGNSVYTPCFVRDGAEWHASARPPAAAGGQTGVLTVVIMADGAGRAEFVPTAAWSGDVYELHVALLGGGFASRVTAGENQGETLHHEFVALAVADHALAATAEGLQRTEFALPDSKITDAPHRALAAWVTRRGENVPVQATGGWLD